VTTNTETIKEELREDGKPGVLAGTFTLAP